MTALKQRAASLDDLKNIWTLIRNVSADVPFDRESDAEQERVLSELMACCTSGLSPIAIGADQSVVGALLARRDDFEWGLHNGDAVHVSYAAVAEGHRDPEVLRGLLTQLQERKSTVLVSVKAGEKFGLADLLKTAGFAHECTAEDGWGDLYKWQPSRAN